MSAADPRSIADIVKDLSSDLGRLVRSEVALAKAEIQQNVTRLGTGAGLFGGAGVIGLFAVEFLLLALMFGIAALGLPLWAAALILGAVLGGVAGVLAMSGKKKVAGASLAPTRAIEHMRTDVQTLKSDIEQVRIRSDVEPVATRTDAEIR